MSDIVEYLRTFEGSDDLGNGNFSRLHEIADEITCLRAELETATHRAARAAQSEIGRQARELSIQIIEANAEIIKLRAELAKYKWRPIAEAPKDETK